MIPMISYGFYASIVIHTDGNIAMLGLYSDSACTIPLTPIHFGDISPGETVIRNFYVKNFASTSIILQLDVSNISPTNLLDYANIVWNREGETLGGVSAISATVSMTIFSNATQSTIGHFDYDITISTS